MATLNLINNFELDSQGSIKTGKQGEITDDAVDQFAVTVTGSCHHVTGVLATASVETVYDDDNDVPADWDYLYFWCDVAMYIQIIGSGSNVIFKVEAFQPFVLPGFDTILAAANTTPIAGGAEPSLTDIDSIVIGNYSGGSGNYLFAVID